MECVSMIGGRLVDGMSCHGYVNSTLRYERLMLTRALWLSSAFTISDNLPLAFVPTLIKALVRHRAEATLHIAFPIHHLACDLLHHKILRYVVAKSKRYYDFKYA